VAARETLGENSFPGLVPVLWGRSGLHLGDEKWNPRKAYSTSFFLFVALGFELRASTLSHSTSPIFVKGFSS
jgi:hypothetical protein